MASGRADSDCMEFWLDRCAELEEEEEVMEDDVLEALPLEKESVRTSTMSSPVPPSLVVAIDDHKLLPSVMATPSCSTAAPVSEVKVAGDDSPRSPPFMTPRSGRTPRQLLDASRFMCDSSMVPQDRRLGDSLGSGSGSVLSGGLPPTPELGISLGDEASGALFSCGPSPEWALVAHDGIMTFVDAQSGRSLFWATPPPSFLEVYGSWRQVVASDKELWWYNSTLDGYLKKDPSTLQSVFQAALDGNYFFIQAYQQVGGSLDLADGVSSRTPLHYACAGGCAYTVQLLLNYVASPCPLDSFGQTPLHFACRYGYPLVTAVVLGACRGEEVLVADHAGCTALHEASSLGQKDCVAEVVARLPSQLLSRLLVISDQHGFTCIDAAAAREHTDVVELLLAASAALSGNQSPMQTAGLDLSTTWQHYSEHHEEEEEEYEYHQHDQDRQEPLSPGPKGITETVGPLISAVKKKLFPTKAHLGSDNKFVYDRHRRQWVLREGPARPQYRFPEDAS
ncbi:hypothetical protein FOL47_006433 [Perkinsus chesapeaki]|uniref:Uncharacterized protein n=1 Tax=Perkinsus chesapeaki TaxID=330153 RepID=A0A7J6MY69_PERCH|nr:hypothetical protein FOL47_006433 [Perkinsus chesapeaki]